MTNAPADLLSLRARVQSRTGLTAVSVGIVGDSAHAASGGYHEGRTDLSHAGVFHPSAKAGSSSEDYSVRLTRDRSGLSESASAMDIGYHWVHGGDAAWLRFNALLVSALHATDPALATVRATNYSPDGRKRQRIDRESGWAVQSSTDSVDVHTHIEWYRDTEGHRQASLDRIDTLIAAAIANQPAPTGDDDMSTTSDNIIKGWAVGNQKGAGGEDIEPVKWRIADQSWQASVTAAVKDLQAKVGALSTPAPVVVDAPAVAAALAANTGFLAALAKAVNDDAAARLAS